MLRLTWDRRHFQISILILLSNSHYINNIYIYNIIVILNSKKYSIYYDVVYVW